MLNLIRNAGSLFMKAASSLQSPLLLLVRLYWGWSFFQTGKGKLEHLDQTTEFFQSLNLPLPGVNAALAGATECFGGALLLVGLASRPVAAALSFTMVVAFLTADLEAVKGIFSNPDAFFGADPFPFLLASLMVLAFGPGLFSLDALFYWIVRRKKGAHGVARAA